MSIRQGLLICDACWRQSNVSPDMLAKSKRAEAQRQGWTVAVRRSIGGLGDYCNSCSQKGSHLMTDPLVAELRKFAEKYEGGKVGSLLAQAAGRIERLEAPEIDRPEPMDKCGNCWACGVDLEWALDPKDPKAHAEYCRWVKSYPYGEKL